MSKIPSFILFALFLLFIIPISHSEEEPNTNSTENFSDDLNSTNDTNETFSEDFDYNPFKDFDFGNIIWLDDTNATTEIKKHELLYLVFYSTWCQHCQEFLPEFIATSKIAEEKNIKIEFAKIDISVSPNISELFEIRTVPSIFLIIKGEKHLYIGERNKENLIKFIDRKLHDDVYKVETLSQIKDFTNENSLVLLSTYKDSNHILQQSFLNYSKSAFNIDFITCQSDECIKEYKEDIILFKPFDEKINKYSSGIGSKEEAQINSVKNFVGIYGVEAGARLNVTEINMIFEHRKKMLFFFRNSSDEEQTKYDKIIKELGIDFRSEDIYTVVSDVKGNTLQENIASTLVIVPEDLPTLLFYNLEKNASDDMAVAIFSLRPASKEQLQKESVKKYIHDIFDGKYKTDLYSEPPLENYVTDGIKYIIGRTFDKDVIEEKNNVFLTLIDSYSEETERLLDIMKNLTKKYTTEENKIVFAYMDAARNQPRNIDLLDKTLPLVFLYANAMPEKEIYNLTNKNFTEITEGEVEDFLCEKLRWEKKVKEDKSKDKEKVEPKAKEEKKETDL